MNDRETKTYIIETINNEYYCGKTNNIKRRMEEHKKESGRKWFSFKQRKNFKIIFIVYNDYEKNIKSFGIKKFVNMLKEYKEVSLS